MNRRQKEWIEQHMNLAHERANAFRSCDPNYDELYTVALEALLEAANQFDEKRGNRFSTFAYKVITRRLLDHQKKRGKLSTQQTGQQDHLTGRIDESTEQTMRAAEVRESLEILPPREKVIIEKRFGLNGEKKKAPLREVAQDLGMSSERVRQL